MRPNRALWTLIKDNASYELTRACGKLCRIPCLKSTFAASKCLFCGLQSTTNSGLQSTEHGDDLHQDRGRLTRGSGLLLRPHARCANQTPRMRRLRPLGCAGGCAARPLGCASRCAPMRVDAPKNASYSTKIWWIGLDLALIASNGG